MRRNGNPSDHQSDQLGVSSARRLEGRRPTRRRQLSRFSPQPFYSGRLIDAMQPEEVSPCGEGFVDPELVA